MDNPNVQTTFVPKRPMIPTEGALRPRARVSLLMLIAIIIFLLAIALTAGLFFYRSYLVRENEAKKAKIQQAVANFDPELTRQLTALKTRLEVSRQLLASHDAFTIFLNLLQLNTVKAVRFTDFKYAIAQTTSQQGAAQGGQTEQVLVTMKGEAPNYAAVAYQSDVLAMNENLKSVIFSNLALNQEGDITFDVKAEISPGFVDYSKTVLPPPGSGGVSTSTPAAAGSSGQDLLGELGDFDEGEFQ